MASYSNYSFSTGASFDPMTFQEILTPYVMYKEEFDKAETAYNELATNADKYKYLGEQLEGTDSKAAKIYKGYADELSKQANDFAKHGLNILNRRGLTNLKRRYSGEIGRLDLANTAMEKERELRRTLNAKDSSMLYAQDNLHIDDFLDNATPNLYNISGTELYTRGAAAGKSAASRVYSAGDAGSTLNGYYRDWVERNGYNKESIDAFRANVSAIPELQQAADAILQERGVLDNLTGNNLARARQAVLNGIIDGAVYTEKHNPVRDPGRMSASESASIKLSRDKYNLEKEKWDLEKNNTEFLMGMRTRTVNNADGSEDTYLVLPNGNIQATSKDKNGEVTGTSIVGNINAKSNATSTEEAAARAIAIEQAKQRAKVNAEVKTLSTKEALKGKGLRPIGVVSYSSRSTGLKRLSVEEAIKAKDYRNIGGWRHGQQGEDVPGLVYGFTNSEGVSTWGNFRYPNKGKVLSDQEIANLGPEQLLSIQAMLEEQGYDPYTVDVQVFESAGSGHPVYTVYVRQEDLKQTGKEEED